MRGHRLPRPLTDEEIEFVRMRRNQQNRQQTAERRAERLKNQTAEEKDRLRRKARNICPQCKINKMPDYPLNRCLKCFCAYTKELKKRRRIEEQLETVRKMGGCARCNQPIPNPVTRRKKVRLVCKGCYDFIRAGSRDKRPKAVAKVINDYVFQAKLAVGMVRPKKAVHTIPRARTGFTNLMGI